MPEDDRSAQRLLAAIDFAGLAEARDEQHRREMAGLLEGLLDVLDNLLALEAHCREQAERGDRQVPHRAATIMVNQLRAVLARAGVEPIEAAGQPLDLALHDVESVRPDPAAEPDTVLEEVRRGYRWRGTLLRRARVIIAGPAE